MTLRHLDGEFARARQRQAILWAATPPPPSIAPPPPAAGVPCNASSIWLSSTNASPPPSTPPCVAVPPATPPNTALDTPIRPGWLWTGLLAAAAPQSRLKGFAPHALQPRASGLDPEALLTRYRASHNTLAILMAECRPADGNHLKFRHPVIFLRMSAGVAFWLLAVHEHRPLAQAERAVALL